MAISCIVIATYWSKIENFYIPPVFSAPAGGYPVGISWRCLMLVKLEWFGYRMVKNLWRYVKLFSSDTGTLRTDREIDRRTDGQICYINTQCLYIRPAVCIASVSLCIRPDLVWYFTYLPNYYITVSGWRTKMATDFCCAMLCISAAYAVMQCLSVRPSVCLSVCLSCSWIIMSKRINMSSKFFHHLVATPF